MRVRASSVGRERVCGSRPARPPLRPVPRLRPGPIVVALALALWHAPVGAFKLDLNRLGDVVQKVVEGREAYAEVGEAREIALGQELAARLLGAAPPVADEEVQRYVNRVGLWVALRSERPGLPWTFGVLDTDSVNAFAAPGGYVFVTRGLMGLLSNEAELAGVLAHEVAHVNQRHHLAAIQATARTRLTAEVVSSLVTENRQVSDAVIGVGMELYAKGLDRRDELDADGRGLVLAARAGYDPYGLAAVLEILARHDPGEETLALMGSTHPPAVDRLDALDRALDQRFAALGDSRTADERFLRIKERLR
jgi:beta-barrel assembly-enhancing protease